MEETIVYTILSILFLVIAVKLLIRTVKKQHKNLPPSPPDLPFIGHIHLLINQPIHKALHNLSQKYGPIIYLRLGNRRAIVVSSPSAVEECFTNNDINFANRAHFTLAKYTNYNCTTVATADYGDHWRNLRRICAIEIFSPSRLIRFQSIRKDEVKLLLKRLDQVSCSGFAKVKLRPIFFGLTTNILMRMVAGKRYYGTEDVEVGDEGRGFRQFMEEFSEYSGVTRPGDFFPVLQWIDYGGFIKKVVKLGQRFDSFLQDLIDEHRIDRDRNTMINHLLSLQQSQPHYYSDEIIKGLILVLLAAGSETTSLTLEWAMVFLLNNPIVLKKVKAELASRVGEDRLIEESDLPELKYLQSVIYETLRLCPIVPLLLPHRSLADCTVGGFHIPADTILFVNVWAVQRDPNLWEDPFNFKPERFQNGKVEGYKFLPFGLGRRACPGELLAHKEMGLTLGSVIQCFDWEKIGGKKIDLSEKATLTFSKFEPLEVMCKTRPILRKFLSQA